MARVALVLGSGGARGYAHIGVIDELEARGHDIVAISGCSMGAVIGGIYLAGQLESYRRWVSKLKTLDILRLLDFSWESSGAIRGVKIMRRLGRLTDEFNIEDLPAPLTIVATDMTRQRELWFQSGSLSDAIRASIAIPGIMTPVEQQGRFLVDGGLLNPLPILPAVASHDADIIIAVNATATSPKNVTLEELLPSPTEIKVETEESWFSSLRKRFSSDDATQAPSAQALGKLDLMLKAFDITQAALAQYKIAGYPPDVLINVPKSVCGTHEFQRATPMIELGRHLARDALDRFEAGYSEG
ncbi:MULTISPECIES: patatin-like phospholipase family protein [Larsenimonas]|uniref:Patatin-like phospholipase family protein n=1 Tax=Larsenimonas suaedae TaxID=1851019 RepID=A0ABU1GXD1_9GAMM|nr:MULTISPECIES: patatin-like phospholipase family protein [Larsenimonas]MCM2971448.1 patatin-like phospholipase family protein [Larsenimonas suaedae]MCM5703556.1 patatin-like phospholipase family protein [Larsenimonas salina]MDR5896704.1 patatin-like phospholipase family protein [Larsenimonas suaedae]